MFEAKDVRRKLYKTNDAYHASPGYSRSQLDAAVDSVARFHALHVSETIERTPPTPPMLFGTLCHEAIINRRGFMSGVKKIAPSQLDAAGKRSGKKWKAYAEKWKAKTLVTPKDYPRLRGVVDSVKAHSAARRLIAQSDIEVAIEWTERVPVGGTIVDVPVKIQIDGLSDLVVEFKTTNKRGPYLFAREIINRRYHFQAAMARRAGLLLDGRERPVVIIAAANDEPFEDVFAYELAADFLATGDELYAKALETIATSFLKKTNRPASFGKVVKLSAPAYGASLLEWQ